MKYCRNCGRELADDAVVCPGCGVPTDQYYNNNAQQNGNSNGNYSAISIVGFVFAFISPLIGLIVSIVANSQAKSAFDEKSAKFSRAGIIISSVFLALEVLVFVCGISCAACLGLFNPNYPIYPDYSIVASLIL